MRRRAFIDLAGMARFDEAPRDTGGERIIVRDLIP